jgi:hypothetical protein
MLDIKEQLKAMNLEGFMKDAQNLQKTHVTIDKGLHGQPYKFKKEDLKKAFAEQVDGEWKTKIIWQDDTETILDVKMFKFNQEFDK